MDLGPHAAFIWAAYAITVVVLAGMIGWLVLDGRAQQRRLESFAKRGVTRRSDSGSRPARS
jgi:heme exporter protein D